MPMQILFRAAGDADTDLIYIGHNYIVHNYIGHNYIGHNYMDPLDWPISWRRPTANAEGLASRHRRLLSRVSRSELSGQYFFTKMNLMTS